MGYIINRFLEKTITEHLFKNKIIILYGPRQVGKTTLVNEIIVNYKGRAKRLNCETVEVRQELAKPSPVKIKDFFGNNELIILDEAHKIDNVGLILKVMIDTYPDLQIIATGSSSFDLANKTGEPLVGRAFNYILYPLSVAEIVQEYDRLYVMERIEKLLIFGSYPEIFFLESDEAVERLTNLSTSYLYKDLLEFDLIKKSSILIDLLQLLALQIGNEVSFEELSKSLQVDKATVKRYIDLLEKNFVLFSLRSFSRNLRKEISKSIKIYFYDLGVRNALIRNFNSLNVRNDVGALWENFCVVERIKRNHYNRIFVNYYFWRTYDRKEIDLVEERGGKLSAFEFKWGNNKIKEPKEFLSTYPNSEFQVINRENYLDFLI